MSEELQLEHDVLAEQDTAEKAEQNPTSLSAPSFTSSNVERGKFRSLTLINWNGFFARTFDLDELLTTLSGGNGAG